MTDPQAALATLMPIQIITRQGVSHPFGDKRTVKQAFPNPIPSEQSDPFLMCDYFDSPSTGVAQHPDDFPINWHPHSGFDICSYLKKGFGRHGDSLGNRETFEAPGMQWISTGSGVEHAEGGATPAGQEVEGFQIWINVPANKKQLDPRYGTVPTPDLPALPLNGGKSTVRVLAGEAFGTKGPFDTVQPVQMMDFELQPSDEVSFPIGGDFDTTILYVYDGELTHLNHQTGSHSQSSAIPRGSVILMDASMPDKRHIELKASTKGAHVMVFAGRKLRQPISWHGPIVLNTHDEITETIRAIRSGQFPPVRVQWDYKKIASKPKE
ncbi:hypothetical protein FisN_3Lh091 [Fistulifera solaris]|uniref:Pirin n=1 Tax=Fistulifera solaris TaxID=1519565 RepID=A0A1Z5JZ02_FISSO|nr:hypothetical protein FisN_3Lh091 [Fistulifera solaris]|eukprot:GAX19149.1 hypothetical protein FisN_3Lh091 [Fistulifera solaris]